MAGPPKKAFLIRIRPEVLAAVEHLAAAELRSANAQIEVLLREALSRRGLHPHPAPQIQHPSGDD